jgi:hypothetical protein
MSFSHGAYLPPVGKTVLKCHGNMVASAIIGLLLCWPVAAEDIHAAPSPPQPNTESVGPPTSANPFADVGRWLEQALPTLGASPPALVPSPNTRIISGHQRCETAANGAPDCQSASEALCRAKGFQAGTSVDTQIEYCVVQLRISSNCAFVTRAICR